MAFEKLDTTDETAFKAALNILESAPGRPQRTASTKLPEASEPTESGTAEPKVEEKTDDEEARGLRHTVAAKDLSVRTLKVLGIF